MGRRWGKTVLGGAINLATASQAGKAAWIVPAYKNGRSLWRWAKNSVAPLVAAKAATVSKTDRVIEFRSGGFLGIYTGDDDADSVRGEWFHLVTLDEAAMMSEAAWMDAIFPTLADADGDAVLISSPRGRNWFWREWLRGQDSANWAEVRSWKAPTAANPDPRIQKAAELARTRVPERTYFQEWMAEFLEDVGAVFRRVMDSATVVFPIEPYPGTFVMGVDWGRSNDFTVLIVLDVETGQVVDIDRFSQIGWELQRRRLVAMHNKWHPVAILAEANAMGGPNVERLQAEGLPVQGFWTSNSTKAEIIESLALKLETTAVRIPNDPVLVGELLAFQQDKTPSGLIKYGAPDGMHDDTVMTLALAAWAADRSVVQSLPGDVFMP